jgi:hypothetical protein
MLAGGWVAVAGGVATFAVAGGVATFGAAGGVAIFGAAAAPCGLIVADPGVAAATGDWAGVPANAASRSA